MTQSTSKSNFPRQRDEYNGDFSQRVVILPDDLQWGETEMPGVLFKLFEECRQPYQRRTLLLECLPGSLIKRPDEHAEVEFLVLNGEVADIEGSYPAGTYVRNPDSSTYAHSEFGCSLFVKLSQIHEDDQQTRIIDTHRENRWLPGPEEGTEIYPLHMWDAESMFLIRWGGPASVKPSINPHGEELFVIQGELKDRTGSYPQGSWIRNPAESWQSWQADSGTLIYYKHGHFPENCADAR